MKEFQPVYVPVGVPTYHLPTAQEQFDRSCAALRKISPDFVCPQEMLLTLDQLSTYLDTVTPDFLVFQNLTFANAAYLSEVLRRFSCPVLIWTLREPEADGGRLRMNSLTGAYSAANTYWQIRKSAPEYVFGAPEEQRVQDTLSACTAAARLLLEMRSLRMAAIGHTPQGFGFGRALDGELLSAFGVTLESIEARELMEAAKGFSYEECAPYLEKASRAMCGLDKTPEKNRLDFARLYKAYADYLSSHHIGALASRCWPDFFTDFGTPVCAVLSMLNDAGVAAACEADLYGALSMWLGVRLSGGSVFFGDPVALSEEQNSITYWHCGMAACSLARQDTGAAVGVHPNRKIGPTMDFGCAPADHVTVFRIGRKPDGSFRFFLLEGAALDLPKQYNGTSIVVRTEGSSRDIVERSVEAGFEPHFAVIRGRHADALAALARMAGIEVCRY